MSTKQNTPLMHLMENISYSTHLSEESKSIVKSYIDSLISKERLIIMDSYSIGYNDGSSLDLPLYEDGKNYLKEKFNLYD